jgi:transposase
VNKSRPLQHRDVNLAELSAIVERSKATMPAEDYATLKVAMETLAFLQQELKTKGVTIERLRQIVFGVKTEKTDKVLGKDKLSATQSEGGEEDAEKKGHGRNGAASYRGADRVAVSHPSIIAGQACTGCLTGKLYPMKEPAILLRVTGMAPLGATVYECEKFRCNLCGEVLTAPAPEGIGDEKYDETAVGMVGLLKYGTGLPFNRIEKLQAGMGIPLPATTQWELVQAGAQKLAPAFDELIRQAAQGDVLHNDDTTMKVLELSAEQRAAAAADSRADERTGVFTSGIVSTREGRKVALFFTGVQHAGENLSDVLKRRSIEQPRPIQMCDALSRNTSNEFETLLANCIAHSRRKFVEVAQDFPEECRLVLETLRDVYKNDAAARQQKMSTEDRLRFHQAHSGPRMDGLQKWMEEQMDQRRVEPNSGLGEAIDYMRKHWAKLTLFLREPGAPLDNNICERALKKAILHRKNALFYKTLNGARVGDIFMSFIHSAELNRQMPFDYLVALLRHHEQVTTSPAEWMPWNYAEALARLCAETTPR